MSRLGPRFCRKGLAVEAQQHAPTHVSNTPLSTQQGIAFVGPEKVRTWVAGMLWVGPMQEQKWQVATPEILWPGRPSKTSEADDSALGASA